MSTLLFCAVLSIVGLTACTPETPSPDPVVKATSSPSPDPVPELQGEFPAYQPYDSDKAVYLMRGDLYVDGFTSPPVWSSWKYNVDDNTLTIMVQASRDDWPAFAKQTGVRATTSEPALIRMTRGIAADVINLDEVFVKIAQYRGDNGLSPVDIMELSPAEFYYMEFVHHVDIQIEGDERANEVRTLEATREDILRNQAERDKGMETVARPKTNFGSSK